MSFIGIDVGATFIKGAILEPELGQLRYIRRIAFPPFDHKEGYTREVDTDHILASVVSLIDELLSLNPSCDGLVMCGQMHGLVLCDYQGKSVAPFVSWQDQRAMLQESHLEKNWYEILYSQLEGKDLRSLGNELRPGLPLTHLFYRKQTQQLPLNVFPASLMDFILANLCCVPPITEATNAEAHGFFNVARNHWDMDALDRLELGGLLLPEIMPTGTHCGNLRYKGRNIPCYVPIGDQQAALLGCGLSFGELSLNIATGSQASLLSQEFTTGDFQTRPYFDGKYLKTITHIPAGRSLNALLRVLIEFSPNLRVEDPALWRYIDEQVGKTLHSNLEMALTFFSGALGDEGYIHHIRESDLTVGNLFRAAFENMANNYYLCALRLSPQQAWDTLLFSGGLVNKLSTLRPMIEAQFKGAPTRLNPVEEETLMGLLIMAHSIVNQCNLTQSSRFILSPLL